MSSSEDIGEGSNNHQAEPRRGLDEQRQESSFNAPVFIPSRQGKEPEASSNTPEPALSTTPSIPSSTPHVASNPATKPVQHARPLSGASFAPSQSSMVFGHRKVNLQILDYTRLWRKLHYVGYELHDWRIKQPHTFTQRALPVLAYWHVPVLIYLDFNALYILVRESIFPCSAL